MIPATFTEETKREFGELFFATCPTEEKEPFFWRWTKHGKAILMAFIGSRTTAAYDLRTKEIREIVEGMIENTESGIYGESYKESLLDLLTRLTK